MKKGVYFTLDALFASLLIGIALVISSQYFISDIDQPQVNYYSKDVVASLSTIKIFELNDTYIESLISSGEITNLNNTVIEQIGEFYVLNKTGLANNLSKIISDKLVPDKFGFEILVDDESVYINQSDALTQSELVSSRRLISGIEKFKPIRGATSKVFLEGVQSKKYSSYLYFGGFVGQGNISGFLEVPDNVNLSTIYLELDPGSDFSLYINDILCSSNFTAGEGIMNADGWDITSCDSSINTGANNTFTIKFLDELGQAFVGGGYVRVDYYTDELQQEVETYVLNEFLPDINGIVNLYSSFFVPGTLDNISIFLHYYVEAMNVTNNTFYFTIGNATVYRDSNFSGDKNFTITVDNITSYMELSSLDRQTVPIRAGFENVTFGYIYEGNADVALVTDVSGSMGWRMDSSSSGTARNCDDPNYNLSTTQRLSVGKCLDKEFSANIINISGNRVGLVSYESSTDTSDTEYPTTDIVLLNNTIGTAVPSTGYSPGGGTCVCCGINSARDILIENITKTNLINSGQSWLYGVTDYFSPPSVDGEGDEWYESDYDDSSWSAGSAILGSTNSFVYTPAVTTELGNDLGGNSSFANLWEHTSDSTGPPNDFTSGILNYTAITFGLSGEDDGWDYDTEDGSGPFGYDDDFDYNEIVSGELNLDNIQGGINSCSSRDCSGAYGIEVEITSELYDIISSGGTVTISFDYEWDGNDNPFESSDEVWIKSYWESPTTGVHYLGAELSSSGGDTTLEIDRENNPDTDFTGSHEQVITQWIEAPGNYYFVLGGKLYTSSSSEYGTFMFDNIQLQFEHSDPSATYADLWENSGDVSGPPNDFSSGTLNYTANTYGISGSDDGWDYDSEDGSGPFGYDDDIDYNEIVGGELELDSGTSYNYCSSRDCSGAYGIEIEITSEMYDIIESGSAIVKFNYEWDDRSGNVFESSDQVWVKARWTSPSSGSNYLGSDLDTSDYYGDTDPEVGSADNPDADFSGEFSQDVASWIEAPGNYYLEIGGKLRASSSSEYGTWRFDNVQLEITNQTNHYYFRKHFNIADIDDVGKGILNILYDDSVTVYLNGNSIYSSGSGLAQYWNSPGISISSNYFVEGDNVIAVDLSNSERAAKFDLELAYLDSSKDHAIMVMTDGQANRQCAEQGTGSSDEDAIQAACDAREDYGISVYAVGYSDSADEATLSGIAACGEGIFVKSDNVTTLQEFYQDVASTIVSASRHSQTIEVQGNISASRLYGDSFIRVDYTPIVEPPEFGEMSIIVEEKNFDNCTFDVYIPGDVRVTEAKLTSYSSEHWTDALIVNDNEVYNLSDFSEDYGPMGDPFLINIPVDTLISGNNTFFIRTGDAPDNFTECSLNNTLIYTSQVSASVSYSDVLENAEGCQWFIEFDDLGTTTINVPQTYSGIRQCYYTNSTISYDVNDTYDDAMHNLMDNLDFDNDGRIYVNIEEEDFVIGAISVGRIPYPWGPAIAEVRVWN